ncbi:hypothetical protein RB200_01630 [Streptomyces sp. PmtG]
MAQLAQEPYEAVLADHLLGHVPDRLPGGGEGRRRAVERGGGKAHGHLQGGRVECGAVEHGAQLAARLLAHPVERQQVVEALPVAADAVQGQHPPLRAAVLPLQVGVRDDADDHPAHRVVHARAAEPLAEAPQMLAGDVHLQPLTGEAPVLTGAQGDVGAALLVALREAEGAQHVSGAPLPGPERAERGEHAGRHGDGPVEHEHREVGVVVDGAPAARPRHARPHLTGGTGQRDTHLGAADDDMGAGDHPRAVDQDARSQGGAAADRADAGTPLHGRHYSP